MEIPLPELDFFGQPPFQRLVRHGYWKSYTPINKDQDVGPLEFCIDSTDDYLDLNDTILHLMVKVQRADAKGVFQNIDAARDVVGLINFALHTIFSDIEIYLNDKKIEGGEGNYAYRAYLSSLIFYNQETHQNQLFAAGFIKDEAGKFDEVTNAGLVKRVAWNNGNLYIGKLLCDFIRQPAYLMNGVKVGLKMLRQSPAFTLLNFEKREDNYNLRVVIESAKLQVRRVRIDPEYMYAVESELTKQTAKYHYDRIVVKTFQLETGNEVFENQNIFNGMVPKFLAIAMTSSDAYNGYFNKNPFHFKHYDLCYLSLRKNGEDVPFEALEPSYKDGKYTQEYMSLFLNLEMYGKNESLSISKTEFANGYNIYMLKLTPDLSMICTNAAPAALAMKIKFAKKLPENVMIILYAVFNGLVEINEDKEAFVHIY